MENDIITPGLQLPQANSPGTTQLVNQGPGPQIARMEGNIIYNQGAQIPPELMEKMMVFFGVGSPQAQGQVQTQAPPPQRASFAEEWSGLSHDKFCLFVLDNENYSDGWFAIAKDRALSKYTPDSDYFRPLSPSLISEVLQLPCIFAKRNRHHTSTDSDHPVVYGRLTEIIPKGSVVCFRFERFKVDYQQTINQNMLRFGLIQRPLHNQLDEEHWCIRSGNLQQVLSDLGIVIE